MFDSMAMQPRAALALVEIFFTWWLNRSFLSKWIPSQHIEGVTKIFNINLSYSVSSIWVVGSPHFLHQVQCMSSCLSWSGMRLAFQNHWSTALQALARRILFVAIEVNETVSLPLSTYIRISMSDGLLASRFLGVEKIALSWNTSRRSAEQNDARIGETGKSCGIPFLTGLESPLVLSTQIAASWLSRKLAVHLRYSSGICLDYISVRRYWQFTKSKKPLISNVSANIILF